MTLDQLRVFVAVAELEHVTRASYALNMMQSAVSKSVAALEGEVGLCLIERAGRIYGAHGRFDDVARSGSWEMFTDRHRTAFWAAAGAATVLGLHQLAKKYRV